MLIATVAAFVATVSTSTYAESTAGVTFVDHQDNGELWVYYNGSPYFESPTNINIDIPENAISVRVYNGNLDEDIEPTIYQQFSTSYTLNLVWSTDQFILDEMEGSVISWDFVHDNEPIAVIFQIEAPEPAVQILPSEYDMEIRVLGNLIPNIDDLFVLEKVGNSVQLISKDATKNTVHNGINFVKLFEILDNDVNPVTVFFGDDTRNYQLTVYERAYGPTTETRVSHSIQSINPSFTFRDVGSSIRQLEVFDNNTSVAVYNNLYYSQQTSFVAFVFLDQMAPVLEGETATVTNVDNPLTESQIRGLLAAWDDTDGDISDLITVEVDNYTANRFTVGTYTIEYSVTDSSDNTSYLTVHVVVSDAVKPTLVSPQNTYTIGYKQTFDVEALRAQIQTLSSDNYDPSVTVTIKSNTYTANKNVIGTYSVVYEATDTSGNNQTKTVQIVVIDNVAPVINGPSTIAKPKNSVLTESQVRSQLSAFDEISGTLTGTITLVSNDYTGNGAVLGSYLIVYSVSDTAGNSTTKQVTINVIDNTAPFWFMRDNAMIAVDSTVTLTREQIISILTQTGQLTVTATTYVSFPQDEYQGNESTPGMYAVQVKTTSTSGSENLYNIVISVYENTTGADDIVLEGPATFIAEYGLLILIGIGVLFGSLIVILVLVKPKKRNRFRIK
jgi:hypothetical protein